MAIIRGSVTIGSSTSKSDSGHSFSSGTSQLNKEVVVEGDSSKDVKNTKSATGKRSASSVPKTKTSVPEEVIRHNISDGELTELSETDRDGFSGAMWCCAGISGGLLIPLIDKLYHLYLSSFKAPLPFIGVLEAIACPFFAGISLAIYMVYRKKSTNAKELVNKIRNRKLV